MQYGSIPGIDKPASRLVQGSTMLSRAERARGFALLDAVLEQGGNAFDTAHVYGSGQADQMLGAWMHDRGVRSQVIIIGKGAHPVGDHQRVTPADITSDLHESLDWLRTDYIDLYLLHRDDPAVPVEPIVDVLNEHLRAGKIRAFGGSNWHHTRLQQANDYAAAAGLVPFVASSPNLSLAVQIQPPWAGCLSLSGPAGAAARAWYAANAMPLFSWSSLAGGFFSGRFRRDNLAEFSSYLDKLCVDCYCSEQNFARLERAAQLGAERGLTPAQVALAYVLSQPLAIHALVGSASPAELRANAMAADTRLSPAELAWLDGT